MSQDNQSNQTSNKALISAVFYARLMSAGGMTYLILGKDNGYSPIWFAFSAIAASSYSNLSWKDYSLYTRLIMLISTIFGVGSFLFTLFR